MFSQMLYSVMKTPSLLRYFDHFLLTKFHYYWQTYRILRFRLLMQSFALLKL